MKVADSDDAPSNEASLAVTVSNVAPTIGTVSVGGSGTACLSGNAVTLGFAFTDPAGSLDTYSGSINWGDGSPVTGFTTSPVSASHSYAAAGTFTITINVADEDGGAASAQTATATFTYNMSVILPPFNADGSSIFKYGSTTPVKIRITDCNGAPVPGLAPRIETATVSTLTPSESVNETPSTSGADTTGGHAVRPLGRAVHPQLRHQESAGRQRHLLDVRARKPQQPPAGQREVRGPNEVAAEQIS